MTVNLICQKIKYWHKNNYSALNIEDFYDNENVPKIKTNNNLELAKTSYKHKEKLDCTKYKTMNICPCFANDFATLKEKFKWFSGIKHIFMHFHNFNNDLESCSYFYKNTRNISIKFNGGEDPHNKEMWIYILKLSNVIFNKILTNIA